MSNSLRAIGWRPTVADWGGGMSVCCTAGPNVRTFLNFFVSCIFRILAMEWRRGSGPKFHDILCLCCSGVDGRPSMTSRRTVPSFLTWNRQWSVSMRQYGRTLLSYFVDAMDNGWYPRDAVAVHASLSTPPRYCYATDGCGEDFIKGSDGLDARAQSSQCQRFAFCDSLDRCPSKTTFYYFDGRVDC